MNDKTIYKQLCELQANALATLAMLNKVIADFTLEDREKKKSEAPKTIGEIRVVQKTPKFI